jgi:hypothetical protein
MGIYTIYYNIFNNICNRIEEQESGEEEEGNKRLTMGITGKIIKVWRSQSLGVKALINGITVFVISAAVSRFALDNETIKRIAGIFLAGAIFTIIFGMITLIADRAGERMRREREGRGGNI